MLEISSSHGELERICIAHEGAEKDAEYLYEEMTKRYPGVPVLMTGIGACFGHPFGTRLHWAFCTYQRINPARPEIKRQGYLP